MKYVAFVMRADNQGEGGILALLALIPPRGARGPLVVALGLFGAALLYGDGVITPAISVLAAVEGLEVAAPGLAPWSCRSPPCCCAPLRAPEARHRSVGRLFGPVMVVWFVTIALARARVEICAAPEHPRALDPWHGCGSSSQHGRAAFLVLGSVVLAVTGGEALYADMGHFGRRPIRLAWFGARASRPCSSTTSARAPSSSGSPTAVADPFYLLAPRPLLYPAPRPRHARHDHRLAGADLGRLLAHAARRSSSATSRA